MAGDTQRAGEVAKAFGALSPELQKALQPIRRMLEEMFGRCDASAVFRGDIAYEGDTSLTVGPQTSIKVQALDGDRVETTEITWQQILSTVQGGSGGSGGGSDWVFAGFGDAKEDSGGGAGGVDGVNDRWPNCTVMLYGGMNPGATVDIYDPGMWATPGMETFVTGINDYLTAFKGSDGLYYAFYSGEYI